MGEGLTLVSIATMFWSLFVVWSDRTHYARDAFIIWAVGALMCVLGIYLMWFV